MKSAAIAFLLFLAVAVYAFAMHWHSYVPNASAPGAGQGQTYESSELDIAFAYPADYLVRQYKDGNAEREWYTLVLLPEGYVPPQGGEGPPAISIMMLPNPEQVPLEDWIRTDARSNFKLSPDGVLTPIVVGGVSGFSYRHSGLYETDAVAVERNGALYLFSVGWQTPQDKLREQFAELLSSVRFL